MDTQLDTQKTVNRGLVPRKEHSSLPPELQQKVLTMFPFAPEYEWFDPEKFETASQCFEALIQAYGKNSSFVGFFKGAILDLQKKDEWEKIDFCHKERAEEACRLLANNERPILVEEIPTRLFINREFLYANRTKLEDWYHGTPFLALPALARVTAEAMPDALMLVTYQERERVVRSGDPVIYAQYGRWYVKVAQWE